MKITNETKYDIKIAFFSFILVFLVMVPAIGSTFEISGIVISWWYIWFVFTAIVTMSLKFIINLISW